MSITQLLSVSEVYEMHPGGDDNPAWINPGMRAVVRSIAEKKSKAGKPFFPCVLADETGSATVECSLFTRPKFSEGDVIELSGKGLRRGEYNGKAQVSVGRETEVHLVGKSVHHAEQAQAAATGAPAVNGQLQPVAGQAVGCALNQAMEMHRGIYSPEELREMLKRPGFFWDSVYEMASDQLRIARLLERGKLKPSIKEREGRGAPPAPAQPHQERSEAPRQRPAPGPDGSVAYNEIDEDVPF